MTASPGLPDQPPRDDGRAIPRVVHQLAIGYTIPEPLLAVREALRAANPDWTFRLLDGSAVERFVADAYGPAMLERYLRIRLEYGAARADFARYLLLYRLGGLYLDLKSTVNRPLDEVVRADDHYLLSQWRNRRGEEHFTWGLHPKLDDVPGGALQQWFVAAEPGHPFLGAVIAAVCDRIDRYSPWRDGVGATGVFNLTGPVAYTAAIWPIRHLHSHRHLANEQEAGLVYSAVGGLGHRTLTTANYGGQETPIVALSTMSPAAARGLALWQRARDRAWVWRLRWRRLTGRPPFGRGGGDRLQAAN